MPPTQQALPPPQPDELIKLGSLLGLHPTFIEQIRRSGQEAIIERAQRVDQTGGMARLLAMAQQMGGFMEDHLSKGHPFPLGVQLDMVEIVSRQYGVPPRVGVELLGGLLQVFEYISRRMGEPSPTPPPAQGTEVTQNGNESSAP